MKPTCPDHPDAPVLAARNPGEYNRQWVCLECSKRLGDAPPVEGGPVWEKQVIDATNKSSNG